VRLVHPASGRVLAENLTLAATPWRRFVGLMGRRELSPGEGLWLEPCNSIHMFFMRFPLDALFLDREKRVRRALPRIRPWRVSPIVFGARSCVELPAGTIQDRSLEGELLALE
jgi:uncharacterized membrane protein (UPF0127 family)